MIRARQVRASLLIALVSVAMPVAAQTTASPSAIKPAPDKFRAGKLPPPKSEVQPVVKVPDGCPAPAVAGGGEAASDWRPPVVPPLKQAQGGEAASDWRPPPIPPKGASGGEAAADWRPPPIPPKDAPGSVVQGGQAASDWRPPVVPPLAAANCTPQASDSADWRPPPIPPKR